MQVVQRSKVCALNILSIYAEFQDYFRTALLRRFFRALYTVFTCIRLFFVIAKFVDFELIIVLLLLLLLYFKASVIAIYAQS